MRLQLDITIANNTSNLHISNLQCNLSSGGNGDGSSNSSSSSSRGSSRDSSRISSSSGSVDKALVSHPADPGFNSYP